MIYYNLPAAATPAGDPPAEAITPDHTEPETGEPETPASNKEDAVLPEIPVGSEVGNLGPDFSVPLYGGGTFTLSDTLGTVTVINFWATWCTPCVAELPHFDELYRNYDGSVEVIAIHSDLITDDVDAYLENYDYSIRFALDDSGVVAAYGGSTMLPQTIVLDKDGVIVYNTVGSVTYEQLEALVAPLIAEE